MPKKIKIKDSKECVRVCVRCRPLSNDERNDQRKVIVKINNSSGEVYIKNPKEHERVAPK